MSIAHFRRAKSVIWAMFEGGSWPITRASGLCTNSATRLVPRTETKASTLRTRIRRSRDGESLYVSGMMTLEDGVQLHMAVIRYGGVQDGRGSGRASMMSCNGRECCPVSFATWGMMWNSVSWGVARYIIPSGVNYHPKDGNTRYDHFSSKNRSLYTRCGYAHDWEYFVAL